VADAGKLKCPIELVPVDERRRSNDEIARYLSDFQSEILYEYLSAGLRRMYDD